MRSMFWGNRQTMWCSVRCESHLSVCNDFIQIFAHLSDEWEHQQNKYASVLRSSALLIITSIESPRTFNNCDANCVPDDTSAIHPPRVFTPADMEVLITHQTGKSLPYTMWVYLLLHLMSWIRLKFVPPHKFWVLDSLSSWLRSECRKSEFMLQGLVFRFLFMWLN